MEYTCQLQNVSILGAAGKMGSGITLLMALEMADQSLKPQNSGKPFILNAIDVSEDNLKGLIIYIENQALKIASKKMDDLRKIFQNITEDTEIATSYAKHVLSILRTSTSHEVAYESKLIFEAIIENAKIKTEIFKSINEKSGLKPWFFSNTSSIPIGNLNREAELEGRILGFHFYNPPAIQKLVELITIPENGAEMINFAEILTKQLKKVVVHSNDIAGFIGNGHFMRDALHGIIEAEKLSKQMPIHEAIFIVNKISQDLLIRPMGIFQLIDYVGIDVVRFIMNVMSNHLAEPELKSPLLDHLFEMNIKGGQYSDGSQKDGFFKYEKGKISSVCNIVNEEYIPVDQLKTDLWLGELPSALQPWKVVNFSPEKNTILKSYFDQLKEMNTNGSKLALEYLSKSKEIGLKLVADGVALSNEDVNTVLTTGFFHAYGPINSFTD